MSGRDQWRMPFGAHGACRHAPSEKHRDEYTLKGADELSEAQSAELIALCQQRIDDFLSSVTLADLLKQETSVKELVAISNSD